MSQSIKYVPLEEIFENPDGFRDFLDDISFHREMDCLVLTPHDKLIELMEDNMDTSLEDDVDLFNQLKAFSMPNGVEHINVGD